MITSKKFSEITSFQGKDFRKWFGNMEYIPQSSQLYSKKLENSMNDMEILNKFKPTDVSLGEILNYLEKEANKNDWMIFYCKDISGVLRTVLVHWGDDGWDVDADSVEGQGGWFGGRQVFSRTPFISKDATKDSPDLFTRVKALEDDMEKIKKFLII